MTVLSCMASMGSDCRKRKGAYVPFSQCLAPTSTLIATLPYTKNGICQALAAKWIAEHANGRSLWHWLCEKGTLRIKQAAVANLMINFTESTVRTSADAGGSVATASRLSNPTTRSANTGGQYYQDFVTTKYLGLYGLKRLTLPQASVVGSMGAQIGVGGGLHAGHRLAEALTPKAMCSKGDVYVLISIMGKGGHAVSAYIGSTDVTFFDPNFGEYWLPTHADFSKWFESFWRTSGYYNQFSKYYLLAYSSLVKPRYG